MLSQLYQNTSIKFSDVIVIDNGTDDGDVLKLYELYAARESNFSFHIEKRSFNFSEMCNSGAGRAGGESVLFLNNDVEILHADWLSEMLQCLKFPDVGIVGAKLLYPDRTVQHNGVIVGLGGVAGHWYIGQDESEPGPMGRFWVRQTVSAVTAACMLVRRSIFDALGGFDEELFPIAYNDIDFCLRAKAAGVKTVWTPFSTLIHHESVSRGSDQTEENRGRFQREQSAFKKRHIKEAYVDDAYNPLYSPTNSLPVVQAPAKLPSYRRTEFDFTQKQGGLG